MPFSRVLVGYPECKRIFFSLCVKLKDKHLWMCLPAGVKSGCVSACYSKSDLNYQRSKKSENFPPWVWELNLALEIHWPLVFAGCLLYKEGYQIGWWLGIMVVVQLSRKIKSTIRISCHWLVNKLFWMTQIIPLLGIILFAWILTKKNEICKRIKKNDLTKMSCKIHFENPFHFQILLPSELKVWGNE